MAGIPFFGFGVRFPLLFGGAIFENIGGALISDFSVAGGVLGW
jgi:hypothetical protein